MRSQAFSARRAIAFAMVVFGSTAACNAIISNDTDQCSTDGDCTQFGAGLTCQDGVCVAGSTTSNDASMSTDGTVTTGEDSSPGSEAGPSTDAGAEADAPLYPPGCYDGVPDSSVEYLNHCTTATCTAVDDCKELGICDGASPALTIPPVPDASTTAPSDAGPPPNCADQSQYVVYTAGSTALQPFLSTLATLAPVTTNNYTIVYANTGSCKGVASQTNTSTTTITGSAVYFDSSGASHACLLPSGGAAIDVGVSDVFADSCGYTVPAGVAEYHGPIQAMTFVVPQASTNFSISAEAAYIALGTGGMGLPDSGAAADFPYQDPSLFFVRNSGSGTQQMIARAIGVPAAQWWGIDRGSSGNVKTQLEAVDPAKANNAFGIVSTDIADAERGRMHYLAFQETAQSCAYYPDSTITSKDKQNIRDGHYPIWGPVHMFTHVDSSSVPSDAAKSIVSRFALPKLDQTLLDAIITDGLVPACAMNVSRSSELGPLSSTPPAYQCSCYFEDKVNGSASDGCVACPKGNECAGVPGKPSCNYGFCEATSQ